MSVYCRGKGLMSTFLLSYFPTFSIYHLPVAASRQTGATYRGIGATSCEISGTYREIPGFLQFFSSSVNFRGVFNSSILYIYNI